MVGLRSAGWAGLTAALFSGPALGASFDCSRASRPHERLICGDAVLSDLDGQLGRLYPARKALLSAHGGEVLQASEQSWLRYATTVCAQATPPPRRMRRGPEGCLRELYEARLQQLAEVGRRVGPFVFNRVDVFAAEPADDQDGHMPGFDIQHVAYPQIDMPLSPAALAWNALNVKSLEKGDDCGRGDENVDYVVGLANAGLISVQWTDSLYCHGTPHGMFGVKTENMVLLPKPRRMTAQDLFGSGDAWMARVQALFWDALKHKGWRPPENNVAMSKREIDAAVIRPDSWMFTQTGISVSFSSYIGGCYACTAPEITVSYADLRPFLSPTAPVP